MDTGMLKGICADRFELSKVPRDLDTIIIGSGMSGLTCAAVLSRMGQRVVVLEQHYVAGGGTHMFQLRGGLFFDSGLHYLVPWSGWLMWAAIGGDEMPLKFDLMGEEDGTFDRIALGADPPFAIKQKEAHLPDLYAKFPDRHKEIDAYLEVSAKVLKRFPFFVLSKLLPRWLQKHWLGLVLGETWKKYAGRTAKEVLLETAGDARLASLLAGPWMDSGAPPDRGTFLLCAAVARGLSIEGAAYPRGGSKELAKQLVPVIEKNGGRVLVRANVQEIVTDPTTGQAIGVRMADNTTLSAKRVISSVGYHNTFGKLIPDDVTKRFDIPRRLPLANSCGFIMCNIGLEGSAEELGLTCANLWYHPAREDGDMFSAVEDFFEDPGSLENDPMIMVTFPSIKDSSWKEEHPDQTTCQLLCMAEYAWFEKYAWKTPRRRGAEYNALKEQWGERLVEVLLRFYPQLEGRIGLIDVSTPLSIGHWLGSDEGAAVGLDHTPERFTDWDLIQHLDMKTSVPGLWITGQDTVTCGQPIVQASGLITALRVGGFWRSIRYLLTTLPPILRSAVTGRSG
jgi:phytoene dehydrogenase-like protein